MAATAAASKLADSASTIKVAVLSDCEGAFGAFDNQDLAGVVAAMSEYAGAKPVNPNDPRKGWTGGSIGGHPVKLVGIGCSNDRADTAIKETKRLMEQLGADVMIGPLSGDESIAVANYAKQHPTKTFVDGAAGAQDTTLKVQAPNFFRFNGDGAQWNAGLGDLAHNKLKLEDGSRRGRRLQLRVDVRRGLHRGVLRRRRQGDEAGVPAAEHDGLLIVRPADADERRRHLRRRRRRGAGPVPQGVRAGTRADRREEVIGNLFWGTPGQFQQLSTRVSGAYAGGAGTAGDLATKEAQHYSKRVIGKWFKTIPPFGAAAPQASSTFTFGYFINTWGLIKGLQAVKGDISGGQKKLQKAPRQGVLQTGYGPIKLDKNRQGIIPVYYQQLYTKSGKLAVKTVGYIPNVDQTFGGTFSSKTPPPGRNSHPA